MKSSLKKLKGLATLHKGEGKERKRSAQHHHAAQLEEVDQASKDMQAMKNCYDSLLSAAAATANSAYEFSEALSEMGTCLLEKTALNDDEESGRVLLMLGKAQFELQKLVDTYRSHIFKTITTPSESLLNELRTVEDMKRQCDEKRERYEYMLATQKEKGKPRNIKSETFSSEELKTAQEEYDDEATLFIFRLKSLKQGQSRSLLTQAARHHAAQLSFFQKGIRTLETVEPHVKLIADQQHIDYQFSGLEDGSDDGYDLVNERNDDGELSFDYGHDQPQEAMSSARNSMEVDQADHFSTPATMHEVAQEHLEQGQADISLYGKGPRPGSQSEPLFLEKKFDPAEKIKDIRQSKKFHTYVLPTPVDGRTSSLASSRAFPLSKPGSLSGWSTQVWNSSPLESDKNPKDLRDQLSGTARLLKAHSILKESNINSEARKLPPPLSEELSFAKANPDTASDSKKIKRQAFSGPITSKAWSGKPVSSTSSVEHPQVAFPSPLRVTTNQPSTSPKVSPGASPLRSSAQLSELHELPRPPSNSAKPSSRPPSVTAHSAPLGLRTPDISSTSRIPFMSAHMPSPLPKPPITMARSFSIPSSRQRATTVTVARLMEAHNSDLDGDIASSVNSQITTTIPPDQARRSSLAGMHDA